jgi:hypothetical protein
MIIQGDCAATDLEIVPKISIAMTGFQSPDKFKTPSGSGLPVDKVVGRGNAIDVVD